jgi:hypothetical protein
VFIEVGTLNVTAVSFTSYREDGGTGTANARYLFVKQHGVTLRKLTIIPIAVKTPNIVL